jgi:hypothetical protein
MHAPEPKSGCGRVCLRSVPIEESFKLKRTLLFLLLAAIPVALTPPKTIAQVNPEAEPAPQQAPSLKYEAYAGFAYTSLNQVNLSRYGLYGGQLTIIRDFGKYFGLMGSGDYYRNPISGRLPGNPGDPSVYSFLVGPQIHANLYEKLSGEVFAELGGEHTGGEGMTPTISFAGGFGGGLTYWLTDRVAIRTEGDRVAGSFTLACTGQECSTTTVQQLGYSTHRTWNPRATIGVVYRF